MSHDEQQQHMTDILLSILRELTRLHEQYASLFEMLRNEKRKLAAAEQRESLLLQITTACKMQLRMAQTEPMRYSAMRYEDYENDEVLTASTSAAAAALPPSPPPSLAAVAITPSASVEEEVEVSGVSL